MTDSDGLEPVVAPGDCVNGDFHEDKAEFRPSRDGLSWEVFGKAYADLPASEQRLIKKVMKGQAKELKEQFQSVLRNNMLSAETRLLRGGEILNNLEKVIHRLSEDCIDLVFNDNLEATRNPDYPKTKHGSLRRGMRMTKDLTMVTERYVGMNLKLAREGEKGQKSVVTQTYNDNSQTVSLTPDDVKSKLNGIISGDVVNDEPSD